MLDVLVYAVLGVGSGAAYAILALGLIIIYRGSGVINFAQGAVAMFSAFMFADMSSRGVPSAVALIIVLLLAGALGAAFYYLVIRQMRTSPDLSKVIATLGAMITLEATAVQLWGKSLVVPGSILPASTIQIGQFSLGIDRVYLLVLTIALTAAIWAVNRYSLWGAVTRAMAENERNAALLGYSPTTVGIATWAIGWMLAGLAGVLIAPMTVFEPATLTLLVFPALAAALFARFTSFPVAAVAGVLIGSGQVIVTRFFPYPGLSFAIPFLILLAALALKGSVLPQRGELLAKRLPMAPASALSWKSLLVLAVVPALVIVLATRTYQSAMVTSLIFVLAALSVVVVTGYAGQISMMPLTFAGLGGFIVAKVAGDLGWPFWASIPAAVIISAVVGVMLGFPALRVRGLSLAVLTLGAAIAISNLVFGNNRLTQGETGGRVPLISFLEPMSGWARLVTFGLAVVVITVGAIAIVSNLRRSLTGMRLLAMRSNERAAAAVGIDVASIKLQAFALSAGLAALAGALLAYQAGAVSYPRFAFQASIMLLAFTYLGGIGAISGAVFAGLGTTGGILFGLLRNIDGIESYYAIITGVSLMAMAVLHPDGITIDISRGVKRLANRFRHGDPDARSDQTDVDATDPSPVESTQHH